ncbi:MAG: VOC family protein [Pseudomonadota bacterium]
MSEAHGTVHWNELMTRDLEKTLDYYKTVCGWTIETVDMGEGDYHIARKGEEMTAGIMDITGMPGMDDTPPHWLPYLAVADVDHAVETTKQKGGQVFRDCFDVPGVGRIAIVADPGGAAVGIMTPSEA